MRRNRLKRHAFNLLTNRECHVGRSTGQLFQKQSTDRTWGGGERGREVTDSANNGFGVLIIVFSCFQRNGLVSSAEALIEFEV